MMRPDEEYVVNKPVQSPNGLLQVFYDNRVLLIAVWFGFFAGLTEGLAANFLRGVPGFAVRVSSTILWIAPAFNLVMFLMIGIAVTALSRLKKNLPIEPWAVGLFTWVFLFGILLLFGKINQYASLILSLGVGVQIARFVRTHEQRVSSFFRKSIVALFVTALLVGTAGAFWDNGRERYFVGKLPQARPNTPNVILITLDTLRADHLSSYGYQRSTSPNLDRLAKSGVLFENAFSNSSWTLPAHASMFTGLLAYEHSADWTQPLDGKRLTLAEALAGLGYLTAAFSANTSYVAPEWGLGQGFTRFKVHGNSLVEDATSTVYGKKLALNILPRLGYFDIPGRKSGSQVNDEFFKWLDQTNGKPFFAFLNYFDLHDPYLTEAPYQTRFSDNVTNGNVINFQFQANAFRRKQSLTEQEIQAELDSYDGCLAYLDAKLGEMLAELTKRGLDKNTLVIVTSDHGEAFGNHDLFGHGNGLYLDTLHVPLIFVWPGKIPSDIRVSHLVSLHNIPASVMALIGTTNGPSFPGRPLGDFWSGNAANFGSEVVLSELSPGRFKDGPSNYPTRKGGLRSLVNEDWHFILSESGATELYAWRNDLNETRNLAQNPTYSLQVDEFKKRLSSLSLRPDN
jgi:arylsulfatase A-like enzyme